MRGKCVFMGGTVGCEIDEHGHVWLDVLGEIPAPVAPPRESKAGPAWMVSHAAALQEIARLHDVVIAMQREVSELRMREH